VIASNVKKTSEDSESEDDVSKFEEPPEIIEADIRKKEVVSASL